MKKHHRLLTVAFTLGFFATGCTSTQKSAATGAAAGAALGTIIADGENHKKGALYGAGIGAISGVAVDKARQRKAAQSSPYYY